MGISLALFVQTAQAQEKKTGKPVVVEIVAKHLTAIGGLEINKKLRTRKMEGNLTIAAIGTPWKLTSIQKAPDKKHNLVEIPGIGVVTEACDGKVAWKKEPGKGIRQLEGRELVEKLQDARFYGFIEMITEGDLTYEHREKVNGERCYVLRGAYRTYYVYIDEATHLVSMVRIPIRLENESTDFDLQLSDYREVDGVQFPFTVAVSIGSKPVLSIKLDRVTHNIEMDDSLFAMPTG